MPVRRPDARVFDEGTRLRLLRTTIENPEPVLKGCGALMVARSQRAFLEERMPPKGKWPDRPNPNWPAVIHDFHAGRAKPPAHRFGGHPLLRDTNLLKNSIAFGAPSSASRIVDRYTVQVGSNLPYAGPLLRGIPTLTDVVTKDFQAWLWKFIKGAKRAAANAPGAHFRRYRREHEKGDAAVERLRADLERSRAAYQGQKVPKGERERRQRVQAQLRQRKSDIAWDAARYAVATPGENDRAQKTAKIAAGAEALRWLLNEKFQNRRLLVRHPERRFLGFPEDLAQQVERLTGIRIRRSA